MSQKEKIVIVGAGPVGALFATMLAGRGHQVEVFEKRPDLRAQSLEAGRSINLVLTLRGLEALEVIDAREEVLDLTVPVLGRMMHDRDGELVYQPYGKDESECNYSVSRTELNCYLLDRAEAAGVRIHFETPVETIDVEEGVLRAGGEDHRYGVLIGADGAPSVVRKTLVEEGKIEARTEMMGTAYKEVVFPAGEDGAYAMDGRSLHIWPRGEHFLMALANLDGSFTGTLYLPSEGALSFEALNTQEKMKAYIEREYPDAPELLGDYACELVENPVGHLGTVWAESWHYGEKVMLIGDAAHGIVPFFGQGLNSGFEDCRVFMEMLAKEGFGAELYEKFFAARKVNTDAIATMALENAVEMSAKVADPGFLLRKKVEGQLAEDGRFPYWSRYRMVMYTHIPYSEAYRIGAKQTAFLDDLLAGLSTIEELDMEEAARRFEAELAKDYEQYLS